MKLSNCFERIRCVAPAMMLLSLAAGVCTAGKLTEITLPGTRVFPESITSTADGSLIVGSLGHGNILRIAPGQTVATEWIKPGTGGLNKVLGVYADEKHGALWVCSNNFEHKGEATAVMKFDLNSGQPQGTYPLPGQGPFCNDIAVGSDGTAYISDTELASVLMLKPGRRR
jgi:streptogramin lyase